MDDTNSPILKEKFEDNEEPEENMPESYEYNNRD